jgi:hypothetical protein
VGWLTAGYGKFTLFEYTSDRFIILSQRPHEEAKLILDVHQFIYDPNFASKAGMRVHTMVVSGNARWKVRRTGVVDMRWKQEKKDSTRIYRRLTACVHSLRGFEIGDLD